MLPVPEVEGEDLLAKPGNIGAVAIDQLQLDHLVQVLEEGVVEHLRVFYEDCPQQLVGLWDVGLLLSRRAVQFNHCHQRCKQVLSHCYSSDQVVEEAEAVFEEIFISKGQVLHQKKHLAVGLPATALQLFGEGSVCLV